ncbi:MAG: HAMP domain-containing histidine kinase [Microbacteriaceae bacterium]|nr:HAMP domain-containing histidine kinase [Microbacteriaceae bacterium]
MAQHRVATPPAPVRFWQNISLRGKITAVTVVLLTLGLFVSGIGTSALLNSYLVGQVDNQLRTAAKNQETVFPAITQPESQALIIYYVADFDAFGNKIGDNWAGMPNERPDIQGMTFEDAKVMSGSLINFSSSDQTITWRAIIIAGYFENTHLPGSKVIAISLRPTEQAMSRYNGIFFGFSIIVVLFGAILTRFLVASAFVPLRSVEKTALEISGGDFSKRLVTTAGPNTEVGRLNKAINNMLGRVDQAIDERGRTIEQMRRFVGDASHELRTPLVTVRGFAELYRMGAIKSEEEVARAMERIEKEAIRMSSLVEDLLSLARLDDENITVEQVPLNILPLVADAALDASAHSPDRVVNLLPLEAIDYKSEISNIDGSENKGTKSGKPSNNAHSTGPISLATGALTKLRGTNRKKKDSEDTEVTESKGDNSLVRVSEPLIDGAWIKGDENKIRQVLTNLINNAVRFTDPDSPIEIGVVVNFPEKRVIISVIDHGDGVPAEIRERIFQRFWRADNSRTRETGGSGLGLAIVAAIVSSHKGKVSVIDTLGGGATFEVSLPMIKEPRNTKQAK